MKVGYARTSILEQVTGFAAQIAALEAAGCEKVFREQVSSVAPRSELEAAFSFVRRAMSSRSRSWTVWRVPSLILGIS